MNQREDQGVARTGVRPEVLQCVYTIHDLAGTVQITMIGQALDAAVQESQRWRNLQVPRSIHHGVHVLKVVLQSDQRRQRNALRLKEMEQRQWEVALARMILV